MMPEFVDICERLGAEYRLPLLLPRDFTRYSPIEYCGPVTTELYERALGRATARGNPVFDRQVETPWHRPDGDAAAYRELFARLPAGLSFLALHFNAPGDIELIDAASDVRTGEYDLFRTAGETSLMSSALRRWACAPFAIPCGALEAGRRGAGEARRLQAAALRTPNAA